MDCKRDSLQRWRHLSDSKQRLHGGPGTSVDRNSEAGKSYHHGNDLLRGYLYMDCKLDSLQRWRYLSDSKQRLHGGPGTSVDSNSETGKSYHHGNNLLEVGGI
jgi:hypothetical protein